MELKFSAWYCHFKLVKWINTIDFDHKGVFIIYDSAASDLGGGGGGGVINVYDSKRNICYQQMTCTDIGQLRIDDMLKISTRGTSLIFLWKYQMVCKMK